MVSMATSLSSAEVSGTCAVDLSYQGRHYEDLHLSVLPGLGAVLGLNFQARHKSVVFQYGGSEPPLSVCSSITLKVKPQEPFENLTADCRPVATKSRRYSQEGSEFIDREVTRLLDKGIVEPSHSQWRAQVVVTKNENHNKRLAIDYSQTINRFTLLDAFPLPNISDKVNNITH